MRPMDHEETATSPSGNVRTGSHDVRQEIMDAAVDFLWGQPRELIVRESGLSELGQC